MTDRDADVERLTEHLAATAELPVERSASRWLGEAEALAADVAQSDLDDDVAADRLADVDRLLAEVDGTGDERADAHVEAARAALDRVRASYQ